MDLIKEEPILKMKNLMSEVFKDFHIIFKKQLDHKIKMFQCDYGEEYIVLS